MKIIFGKKNPLFQDAGAGLVAAAMISIVPGYISRSVAGSYDNEGIAIFCMLFTYAMWIKSVKTGSVFWSVICSLAYFYMVSYNNVWFEKKADYMAIVIGKLVHQSLFGVRCAHIVNIWFTHCPSF